MLSLVESLKKTSSVSGLYFSNRPSEVREVVGKNKQVNETGITCSHLKLRNTNFFPIVHCFFQIIFIMYEGQVENTDQLQHIFASILRKSKSKVSLSRHTPLGTDFRDLKA